MSVTYRGHLRALLALGLPLIASHMAQFAIHVTDTLMLGWYDVRALAAVVLAGSFYFVFFIVGSGFAWAVMPMVASSAASGDDAHVRRVTRMGLWISFLFAALIMPPLIWSEQLLKLLGQEPQTAALAQSYLRIAGWGVFPSLWVMVLKSYLAALERTRVVLLTTLIAAALNAAVNWLLIFGNLGLPEMGLRGAAIASVATQLLSLLILCMYAKHAMPEHALFQRLWRPDREAFNRVFRLGWPIGLTNLAESGLFSASALMMGWIGTIELAAHGIAIQLASLTFMVHMGLSNAATVRAGNAFGRKDEAHLRIGGKVALALSMAFALFTMGVFLSVPDLLIGAFVDPTDPARPRILAVGASLLAVAAIFQLADGAQVVALGLLRGVQDTRVPMLLATISYWIVGLPSSYALGFWVGLGGVGLWLGLVIGLALAGWLLLRRFWAKAVFMDTALA